MKFFGWALTAVIIFVGLSVFVLDVTTAYFGMPTRGVSYGIAIYYLAIIILVTGSTSLFATKWHGLILPLSLGTFVLSVSVLWLLPQPNIAVRLIVAVVISLILVITMTILKKLALGYSN